MCNFFGKGCGLLPLAVVVVSCATFITTYIIAVVNKHVPAFFPYISDTGAKPPESCVFGQFLNIVAVIATFTMYVRYKQVASLTQGIPSTLNRLNLASLVIGLLANLGMSVVANFQESTVIVMHLIGAFVLFVGGLIYELIHVILSYLMSPTYNGRTVAHIRLVVWLISLIAFISSLTCGAVASARGHKMGLMGFTGQSWKKTDPGYEAHITSTISEWVMGFTFLAFFLTFIRDFQKVTFRVNTHLYATHMSDQPIYVVEPDETTRLVI